MFDFSLLKLGFSFLLTVALWPIAMVGFWADRFWDPYGPGWSVIDVARLGAHLLALLFYMLIAAVVIPVWLGFAPTG